MPGRIIAMLLIAAMLGVLFWQYRAQYRLLERHEAEQREKAAQAAALPQQQCEATAAARLRALDLSGRPGSRAVGHFQAAAGQCYQLIESRRSALGTDWRNVTVYDPRGRVLASFGWHSYASRANNSVSPYTCTVTLPSGEHRDCASEAEFRQLIAVYMR